MNDRTSKDRSAPQAAPRKDEDREARRAAALRANLRKRKTQQRGRAGKDGGGEPENGG